MRFVELTCPNVGHDRWDQHQNLKKGHEDNARAVDQPIGALLADLKQRGLLDSTLVVFSALGLGLVALRRRQKAK